MFQYSEKPVKHHRRECLKQFPLKPSLTWQCTSCWSYALFVGCFKPVTFPENLQWGSKAEPPAGSLKEFCRSCSRFWKRGQKLHSMFSTSGYFRTAAWADLRTLNKSGNTGVNLHLPWHWAYNSDLWPDSILNNWPTPAIEKWELVSQTFVKDFITLMILLYIQML